MLLVSLLVSSGYLVEQNLYRSAIRATHPREEVRIIRMARMAIQTKEVLVERIRRSLIQTCVSALQRL